MRILGIVRKNYLYNWIFKKFKGRLFKNYKKKNNNEIYLHTEIIIQVNKDSLRK